MKHNPTTAEVSLWLSRMSHEQLRGQGWAEINQRFHGIVRAARPFIQEQFADEQEQQAAFEGLALALLAVSHFEDVSQLASLFGPASTAPAAPAHPAATNDKDKADPSQSELKSS